jgi:hypothetical protein
MLHGSWLLVLGVSLCASSVAMFAILVLRVIWEGGGGSVAAPAYLPDFEAPGVSIGPRPSRHAYKPTYKWRAGAISPMTALAMVRDVVVLAAVAAGLFWALHTIVADV